MADEHESNEAEVSLSLPMKDWEWLLNWLSAPYDSWTHPCVRMNDEIYDKLRDQFHRHKAAQATGTATDAANVVLDEMEYLDPPEPIAGDSR